MILICILIITFVSSLHFHFDLMLVFEDYFKCLSKMSCFIFIFKK